MIAAKQFDDIEYAGFYNVGPDDCDCVATGELVEMFCRYWGEGVLWINKAEGGPHEANFLKLDCSKLKKVFDWVPVWNVDEAVKKTVEWSKVYSSSCSISACMDQQFKDFLNRN